MKHNIMYPKLLHWKGGVFILLICYDHLLNKRYLINRVLFGLTSKTLSRELGFISCAKALRTLCRHITT